MKLADELEAVAKRAADKLRAAEVPAITVYELAEAIQYEVRDDVSKEESLENARNVFARIAALRAGEEPCYFKRELEAERIERGDV